METVVRIGHMSKLEKSFPPRRLRVRKGRRKRKRVKKRRIGVKARTRK